MRIFTIVYSGLLIFIYIIIIILSIKFNFTPIYLQSIIKIYLLYVISILNLLTGWLFINYYQCIDFYVISILNIRSNILGFLLVLTVLLVSSCVILNSIDYLCFIDSHLFLIYIILFQISMILFILSHNLILSYLYWDILGIISYLLINYWSSRINCGIKAIIYNKIGDCSFIFILVLSYSYITYNNYYAFMPLSLIVLFYSITSAYSNSYISFNIIIITIIFTKSAQLPFSSWLLIFMV